MSYRDDPDLSFLARMTDEDLDPLYRYLVYDKDGGKRYTETLSNSEEYKSYPDEHRRNWRRIAEELQCYGGNTFANLLRRGQGVLYREILLDVCDKCKVNYNKTSSIGQIELCLLQKILLESIEKMDQDDLEETIKTMDLKVTSVTPQAVAVAVQAGVKMGGFTVYQSAMIVANAVSKAILGTGLALTTNATITRALSVFAGPIGWVVTGAWTAADLAGPAYRVTIPAVLQVAFLRCKHDNGQ